MVSSFQARNKSRKSAVNLIFIAMVIFAMGLSRIENLSQLTKVGSPEVPASVVDLVALLKVAIAKDSPASSMDVMVPSKVNALNGTTARLPCTFTSCYKIDISRFAMNWTYKEDLNDTEEIFMTFKHRMTVIRTERFDDRVVFAGNLEKNDLSITISDVQMSDSGIYKCYVRNPPDRQLGNASISLNVVTELPPPRDSTIAVVMGASVGGILAVLILSMVIIKCVRRRRKQELISDEQKMEEEGKTDAEGGTEEGTKHAYSLPEDVY